MYSNVCSDPFTLSDLPEINIRIKSGAILSPTPLPKDS